MWFPMMGFGVGALAIWWVFRSVFVLVVVCVVIALVARSAGLRPTGPMSPRSSGLDILEQRYARGEIQREEYLQKRKDILARDGA